MAILTTIHRNGDETISFQLYKADGTVEDVDDCLIIKGWDNGVKQ